jgi:hypothetical protein
LARDVDHFARGVERLVKVPLTDGQFSALASFAYNVGLENFRKSSVLRAVNAQDFAAVPRRLSLWVKSRGRVLPGLVNRRAAEAAMFLAETRREPRRAAEASATGPCRDTVEPVSGPPLRRSSTSLAAMISALAGVASSLAGGVSDLTRAASSSWIAAAAAFIVVAAALWIIRERRLKSREDGI